VTDNDIARKSGREGPDTLTLGAGVLALAVAGSVLLGFAGHLQWLLALAAVGVGIFMLVTSLRRKR
jgi:divalent metal cation (Fe/Co/Zn/Cd) transporter